MNLDYTNQITPEEMRQFIANDIAALGHLKSLPDGSYEILTRKSRNPNLSRNGGDYEFWSHVSIRCHNGDLVTVLEEKSSCEFPMDLGFYWCEGSLSHFLVTKELNVLRNF